MFSHFDTGGLQTAMVRMARWCQQNHVDCLIIFESYDDQMLGMCKEFDLEYLHSFDGVEIAKAIRERVRVRGDVATVITFELPEFLFFEAIRQRWLKKINIQHFIYNVWVGSMSYGRNIGGAVGGIIKTLNRSLVRAMHKSNQAFYMDVETRNVPLARFGINIENNDSIILPLPMFVSKDKPIPHGYDGNRVIMTVARARFPYKGYLLGLIRDFSDLKCKFPDLCLRIVSFGPDRLRLEQAISECPEYVRSSIELIGRSTTDEIRSYMQGIWLYVGMGTTVLDAADEGIPSIVSCHSTEENLCVGFFSDNPMEIGRAVVGVPGIELLEKAALLSLDEYKELSIKTHEAYRRAYDIEAIMPRILSIRETSTKRHVSLLYTIGYIAFYKVRNLMRRTSTSAIN